MTFIVDVGDGLHYLPAEEAYIGEHEFAERARHTQAMLSCVGNEQRALIIVASSSFTANTAEAGDILWSEQPEGVFGTKDIRQNIERYIRTSGIAAPTSGVITAAVKDYLEPMGVLEFIEQTPTERLYVRGPNYALAAAASGHLFASGLEHNVALAKMFGYGRRLNQETNHESSPAFTRAGILAYAHAATQAGRCISLKEISTRFADGILSRSYKKHIKALIEAGIISDKSGAGAAYVEHPEYGINGDDLPTAEETEGSLNSRIMLAIHLLRDSGAPSFTPRDIAQIIFTDLDEANTKRHASRITGRLDQFVQDGFVVKVTDPKKAVERIGLSANQMAFAEDILRIIDGISAPTSNFIEDGLAELDDILMDPMAVGHLLQRTRANVAAYDRKSRGLRRYEIYKFLQATDRPVTVEEIADAMGLNANYLHSVMQDLRQTGRAVDTPSYSGRAARWQLVETIE